MNSEPAITITSVTTAIAAAIALLVSFGFNISDDTRDNLLGLIAALWPIVTAYFIRRAVYSKNTVEKIAEEAHFAGSIGEPKAKV